MIRTVIARSEIDLMTIRKRYKERYGKSLFHDIKVSLPYLVYFDPQFVHFKNWNQSLNLNNFMSESRESNRLTEMVDFRPSDTLLVHQQGWGNPSPSVTELIPLPCLLRKNHWCSPVKHSFPNCVIVFYELNSEVWSASTKYILPQDHLNCEEAP